MLPGAVVVALLLLVSAAPLAAHPSNVAAADIAVGDRRVEIALSVNLFELDLLLSLDRNLDASVTVAELEARRAELVRYLARTVELSLGLFWLYQRGL